MKRVASLHPSIEIPDSRIEHFDRVGAAQLIADNACAHYFLLGRASPPEWRSLNLADYQVWGSIGDQAPRAGLGSNVLGDPLGRRDPTIRTVADRPPPLADG